MRELTSGEIIACHGGDGFAGMSGQCIAEGALNYVVTGGAIAAAIGSGGLLGAAALAGAALGWSSWYRDCGPNAK